MRRALAFVLPLVLSLVVAGCDTQLDLNECTGAPSPPTNRDYLNLDRGTAVVDGPEGRLALPARVDSSFSGARQLVALGASGDSLPLVEVGSLDPDTVAAGDEFFVTVGYNVHGHREGGSGRMKVTAVTAVAVEGTFAGCVRSENSVFPIYGPYRLVRGGFHAARGTPE